LISDSCGMPYGIVDQNHLPWAMKMPSRWYSSSSLTGV
jgi:hypothetical protein